MLFLQAIFSPRQGHSTCMRSVYMGASTASSNASNLQRIYALDVIPNTFILPKRFLYSRAINYAEYRLLSQQQNHGDHK